MIFRMMMQKLPTISLLAFLALLIITFAGCDHMPPKKPQRTLTLNLQEGDPPTWHPYLGVDLRSRCLFLSLFEPLMRRTPTGHLECAAAESVEIDPSQTVYTFHIRPHTWSNGRPVTAHHFEKGWKYVLKPGSPCIRTDLFYPIKNAEKNKRGEMAEESLGIHCPDSQTLVVTLEQPTSYFLELTATSFFSPIYDPSEEEPNCFNGPYQIKQWVADQSLILEANPYYWGADSIDAQEVHFTMIRDPMTAFAMYEKGELDLVGDPLSPLPYDLIPTLEQSSQLQKRTISRIFYLLLNTEKFPLESKKLRQALSLAIDRQQLTQHLFYGQQPTLTSLPKTLSGLSDSEIQLYQSSPEALFEEALQELQIDRAQFPTLTLSYAELSGQKKLAEFIQAEWKEKLAIQTNLICQEWNVHSVNLRSGDYQIGTLQLTTLYQDPMFYFDLFRDKKSFFNYCRWENPHFKALLEASEKTQDPQSRSQYLQEAEKQLLNEMPVISLFTQTLQYLIHEGVELDISDLGIYDFRHCRINL